MCACVRVCFEICLYKRETHFIQDKWPSNNSASNLSKINHTLIAQSQCFKGMLGGTDGRATIYWSSASTQSGGCALVSLVSSLGDYSSGSHFTDKMARSWLDSFLSAMASGFLCQDPDYSVGPSSQALNHNVNPFRGINNISEPPATKSFRFINIWHLPQRNNTGASEMAHWIKELATTPEDLGSIPGHGERRALTSHSCRSMPHPTYINK